MCFKQLKGYYIFSVRSIIFFRTFDCPVSEHNPIRLVFKIAKELLNTKSTDEAIYEAKIRLANELYCYDKVKNEEQNKALVYLLEYLFLIEDSELENKYKEFRKSLGGVLKMTVDEIREKHLKLQAKLESAESLLDILDDETIATKLKLSIDLVKELREKQNNTSQR